MFDGQVKTSRSIFKLLLFSSPKPKVPGELIGREGSVVCGHPSTLSNDHWAYCYQISYVISRSWG